MISLVFYAVGITVHSYMQVFTKIKKTYVHNKVTAFLTNELLRDVGVK